VRTTRDSIDIELWAGVVDTRDVPSSLRLLDDVLHEALWLGDSDAMDIVSRVYRGITGSSPPDTESDPIAAEHEIGDTLRQHARHGHLRLSARPRPRVMPVPAGDGLMNPFADEPEPPTPATTWFSIVVVDDVGDPIDGVELEFNVLGEVQNVTTDGSGRARLDGMEGGTALVAVRSTRRVREILTPRWATPRTPVVPESTEAAPVHVERLDDHFDPIRLDKEIEATLVILPRFRCREIVATTFDFGRSFFRREGIPALAMIAEELQQDDGQVAWIFGHTDKAGPDLLNKRLSERRAKAIFAVLTHDFAKWDEMWRGTVNESPWSERWGTREVQHMLNTLHCPSDNGQPLGEDGDLGSKTRQAIKRFQRKEYPDVPDEQADLPANGNVDAATREQLFLAYAKQVARDPVDTARIAPIGASPFMGCGEFNPLSLNAHDRESRRAVIFVFDPAAQPQNPPCQIGTVSPCNSNLADPPPDPEGTGPFYRCAFYQSIANCCPAAGGADLAHDVIVRFFMNLQTANGLPHKFVLEAEDMPDDDDTTPPFRQERTLESDARSFVPDGPPPEGDNAGNAPPPPNTEPTMVELHFTHVPDAARYRLRAENVSDPHTIFDKRPFHMISELSAALDVQRMPRLWAIIHAPPPPDPF
jgi:hypothetical protein